METQMRAWALGGMAAEIVIDQNDRRMAVGEVEKRPDHPSCQELGFENSHSHWQGCTQRLAKDGREEEAPWLADPNSGRGLGESWKEMAAATVGCSPNGHQKKAAVDLT